MVLQIISKKQDVRRKFTLPVKFIAQIQKEVPFFFFFSYFLYEVSFFKMINKLFF